MMESSSGTELLTQPHDLELCEFAEKNLYTAIVSGSMDQLGVRNQIEELGFPVFAAGIKPVDSLSRGRVNAYNVPVECGDGVVVVVVPKAIVEDVIELASEKARRENSSRAELMQGAYLRDVFQKYGVL